MINHPPQRKLRRSFGSQPVGCLGGPRQPEAGVAVQATQAQSSRWIFLSSDDGDLATCRPADLPTCRPADLPNLVAGDHRGAGPFNLLQPHLRWGLNLHLQGRAFRPMPCLESTAILPRPHLLPRVSSDIIAQHYLSLVKNPSRRKHRGTPPRQVVNSGSVNIN
jgi:hypothetical protein